MATQNLYALTDTWNSAPTTFVGIGLNVTDTASAAGSLLMDLQVGGSSRFSISKAGSVLAPIGSAAAPTFAFGVSNTGWYSSISSSIVDLSIGGTQNLRFSANGMFFTTAAGTVQVSSGGSFSFSSGTAGAASADTILVRDAASTLAQRDGVNAQTFRVYNTYTDASNYERGELSWSANNFTVGTTQAGTGLQRRLTLSGAGDIVLSTGNTQRWNIAGAGHFLAAADNTYDIGASGASRPRDLFLGRNFASAGYVWPSYLRLDDAGGSNGVRLYRAGSGILTLYNTAETDFGRLQFGGTTSSFPALKRSGGNLHVVNADDTAFASLVCAQLVAGSAVTANNATAVPAGGSAAVAFKATSTADFGVFFGSGAPTLSAAKGSLYLRSDGTTTNDRMYVNTNGSTTWTAVTTAA